MVDYFVGTKKECDDLVAKMDAFLGYPNPETNTITYAIPRRHAKEPGLYFVIIKEVYSPLLKRRVAVSEMSSRLSAKEKTWTDEATLKAAGAFPVNPLLTSEV